MFPEKSKKRKVTKENLGQLIAVTGEGKHDKQKESEK